jgi:hypothetical protein
MSKQFRVHFLPSDIQYVVAELRARVGIKIIEEITPTSAPVQLLSRCTQFPDWRPLAFKDFPVFNCKVIALKSRTFVLKARTMFATKFVRDLNAKVATMGDGRRGGLGRGSAAGNTTPDGRRSAGVSLTPAARGLPPFSDASPPLSPTPLADPGRIPSPLQSTLSWF